VIKLSNSRRRSGRFMRLVCGSLMIDKTAISVLTIMAFATIVI
jgi:hypothetical protein